MDLKTRNLSVLFSIFCVSVVMTNMVSGKLISFGPFIFVAGTLLYPLTFLLTDTISEVYGKREANTAVLTGFFCQIIAVVALYLLGFCEALDPSVDQAWSTIFSPVGRITVASMLAYLASQLVDVRLFHFIRAKTGTKHLWLRNNVSTAVSQLFDTLIFVFIAFAGTMPLESLAAMAAGQYMVKFLLALIDTPVCYASVWLLRGRQESQ